MTSFFTARTPEPEPAADAAEPKDQGLKDAADSVCTTPRGWTPPEAFDSLAKEEH